ncbi:unnamed protein product [Alopecurus aequalis]
MSSEGGAEMASRCCTSPALGPLDDNDLLAEILLRLPPKPSSLPRISLVCKRWRSIATNAAFRRRFRTHHQKPPILGVFEEHSSELKFMPLLDPPDHIPSECFSLDLSGHKKFSWSVLGCRHGRILLRNWMANVLLVFEPISGDTLHVLIPPVFVRNRIFIANGAVLCAAGDDHVHGDCHTSPFKVVLVGTGEQQQRAVACVYSSETGVWGGLFSTTEPCTGDISFLPCTLVRNILCWPLIWESAVGILQFDLDNESLTVINGPPADPFDSQIQIIRAEDVGLGFAILSYPSFQLWDHIVDCHGVSTWVLRKTVNMDKMLGWEADDADIEGYAEDADAIFMSISNSFRTLFVIVHLESMKVEKHRGSIFQKNYHPFTNFYTAGTARA